MITEPDNYRAFCRSNGIPFTPSFPFYQVMCQLSARNGNDSEFKEYAIKQLKNRLRELNIFSRDASLDTRNPESLWRAMNLNFLIIMHEAQLRRVGGKYFAKATIQQKRADYNTQRSILENPDTFSELFKITYGDRTKALSAWDARTKMINNSPENRDMINSEELAEVDRMVRTEFKGRQWSYP